jgi:hypothetical protein
MAYQHLRKLNQDKVKNFCDEVQCCPVTGLEWPRGFQEVEVPRLHDNGTGWW